LGSDILTFSVENSDPRLGMRLATEYANAFTEYQRQLDTASVENELKEVRQPPAEPRQAVRPARRTMRHYSAGGKP
jgi:hypothetical protein